MNILAISSFLPYPLYSGGHIRLYNLLKILSKKHAINLICEKRNYQTNKDEDEVRKVCSELFTVDRRPQWSMSNILKTGFSLDPFLIVGHTNKDMKIIIKKQLMSKKFDLIHVETSYVFQNLPKTKIPTVLVEHNIEYLVYKKYADKMPFFLRPLLYIDVLKLKLKEKRFWKKANCLVAVSEKEKELMSLNNVFVVPNGVDVDKFKIKPFDKTQGKNEKLKMNDEIRILFIGDFRWIQNRDAAVFLIKEIWSKLSSKFKIQSSNLNVKLWIVGKNIPSSIKNLTNDESIIFDENAPEKTEEIYQRSFVLVAPIRVGGGTQYKILEAMSSGIPVVTTTLGIEGLKVFDKKEVIVADSADSFVQAIIELVENEGLRKELIKNARKMVVENYDWKIIAQKLEEVYKSVIT